MRIISGEWRGRPLVAPPSRTTRPTSDRHRGSLFSLLLSLRRAAGEPALVPTWQGLRVLDLYAGSGALGLEALSRGAARAAFIDSDRAACDAIRRNLDHLQASDRGEVVSGTLPHALRLVTLPRWDLVFCDAPYADDVSTTLRALGLSERVHAGTVVAVEVASGRRPALGAAWRLRHARDYGGTEFLFLVPGSAAVPSS